MKTLTLDDNDMRTLARVARGYCGAEAISSDVATRLVRRGLVEKTGDVYERTEWQRVVARLPVVRITPKGLAAVSARQKASS